MCIQVTLGIWQATGAQDIIGKVFGVYFPVLAFVAIGGDPTHVSCQDRLQSCQTSDMCLVRMIGINAMPQCNLQFSITVNMIKQHSLSSTDRVLSHRV